MTDAGFPGTSQYFARLEAWRDGSRVNGRLTVFKTGGSGYWIGGDEAYGAYAVNQSFDGRWGYDFRQYDSRVVAQWGKDAGPGTHSVQGWVEMRGFGRATPGNMSVTIPPNRPAAPSTPSITKSADNNILVSWNRNASSSAPYGSQQVQRRAYTGSWSAWANVATIGTTYTNGGSHSWRDTSGKANVLYQYRIKAANGAGEVYSGVSVNVFGTPATPGNFKAAKQSNGGILLTWAKGTPWTGENRTSIEYSTNGGSSWTALVSNLAGDATSYTMSSPPDVASIVFRARHLVQQAGSAGNNGASAWTTSNTVGLTVPPNPPTALVPNGVAFDAALPFNMTWQHNTADSSSQTAYEIQYRIGTGAWISTGKITSTDSIRAWDADTFTNGNTYEYQVRTWGAHANPSPWSATANFTTSTPPLVTVTGPESPLVTATAKATWEYSDAEGSAQSSWEAELIQEGSPLETRSGNGAATSVQFRARLNDGVEYQVRVRVRDGSLLWSEWDQLSFTTAFPLPPKPIIIATWNPNTGTTEVIISNPGGTPAAVSNQLMRSVDSGLSWQLITEAAVNGLALDPTMPLGTDVLYRVLAVSDLPSYSESQTWVINSDYSDWKTLRNLAAYGSFRVMEAAPRDARRNKFYNPSAINGTNGFNISGNQATLSNTGSAVRFSLNGTINGIALNIVPGTVEYAVGDSVRMLVRVRASRSLAAAARFGHSQSTEIAFGTITTDWKWMEITATAMSLPSAGWGLVLRKPSADWTSDDWVEFDRVLYAVGSDIGDWFDGSSNAPEYFTNRWSSSANNGASIQGYYRARGASDGGGRYALGTGSAVRPRATQTPTLSNGVEVVGSSADMPTLVEGLTYTAAAWLTLDAPVTGDTANRTRRMFTLNGTDGVGPQAPNEAGRHLVRFTFTVTTGRSLRLAQGMPGQPDHVWENFTLVEGDVPDLVPFDGDTVSDTEDVSYGWDGTRWASTSTKSERVYVGPEGGYWSAGENFDTIIRLRLNQGSPPRIDLETGVASKALHYFAGRTSPVEMQGTATRRTGSVEFVVPTIDEMLQVRRLALMPAPHLFRLPDSTALMASLGPVSDSRLDEGWYKITMSIQEVDS